MYGENPSKFFAAGLAQDKSTENIQSWRSARNHDIDYEINNKVIPTLRSKL
jgi:hypothetical protein